MVLWPDQHQPGLRVMLDILGLQVRRHYIYISRLVKTTSKTTSKTKLQVSSYSLSNVDPRPLYKKG